MNAFIRLVLGLLLSFTFGYQLHAQASKLPPKYKKWLREEVIYIITHNESKVFKRLENDRERNLFIEEFWKQRDPTPGTPTNEFKDEHYRRIRYANHHFGKGTPVEGWSTDRGRFYIILGEPQQIQTYLNNRDTHPIIIWYYQGNPRIGQPPQFRLLFFQRGGVGEFELYSPLIDGPKSLVPMADSGQVVSTRQIVSLRTVGVDEGGDVSKNAPVRRQDQLNFLMDIRDRTALQLLRDSLLDELADAALSNFMGKGDPSTRLTSSVLIGEVEAAPHKSIRDDYAYDFLEHKAVVEVSYSVNHIPSRTQLQVLRDRSGLFFVNYAVQPEFISIDRYKEKYFTNIKMSVRVTDNEDETIFQHSRDFPIELKKKQLDTIGERPFNLHDSFPMIPGVYTFHLLLENTVTKEFTSYENELIVPRPGIRMISPLILANKINTESPYADVCKAYQIGDLQLYPQLKNQFGRMETLYLYFQIFGMEKETLDDGILEYVISRGNRIAHRESEPVGENGGRGGFLHEFDLSALSPGTYRLTVYLRDAERKQLLTASETLTVTSHLNPEPWIVAQTNPPREDPVYSYLLGNQFLNTGDIPNARRELGRAYARKPFSLDYALRYARVLLLNREVESAYQMLLPFAEEGSASYALYFYLGKCLQAMNRLEEAVSYYQKALSHKGDMIEILNDIGRCYYDLNELSLARRVWEKSLEINPDQEEIKALLAETL